MADIDLLKRRLAAALDGEKRAMARLRRAQTIFDKHYSRRLRLQEKLQAIDREIAAITSRLKGE